MALRRASAGEVVCLLPGMGDKPEKTAAIVKHRQFEAVRLVVKAGAEIPPHHVEGPISLQCVSGCAVLGLDDGELELRPGQWTYLEGGARHSVRGVEDAVLLLTIIFRM